MRAGWVGPSCLAVFALVLAGFYPIDNPDTFGHLAAGRQISELGSVPRLDTFSYYRPTPQPWVNYEWLSGLALFETLQAGGFGGLNLFKGGLLAALAVLLVAIAQMRAGSRASRLTALLLVAAVPAVRFRLSVRPHLLGLPLCALYMLGLLCVLEAASHDDARRRRQIRAWVIGLALAHVAWVNVHGSHLLGVALTVLACLASVWQPAARKPLAVLLLLEGLASCISPYGPRILVGAIAHVFDPKYRALISEWQAWSPAQPGWFAIAVGLQAFALALSWRGLHRDPGGRFMGWAALLLLLMAARSLRFIADFLLLSAPVLGEALVRRFGKSADAVASESHETVLADPVKRATDAHDAALEEPAGARKSGRTELPRVQSQRSATREPLRLALRWALVAAIGAAAWTLALRLPPYAAFGMGADTRLLPAASGSWLAARLPRARVFAAMEDAWYLMYAAPHAQFLLDGRVPFYGSQHILAMLRVWSSAGDLRATLTQTRTDAVIVQPVLTEHRAALASMLADRSFRLVLIENRHALFVRTAATASSPSGLRVLVPGYEASWLLARRTDVAAVERELAELREQPSAAGYVGWVDSLLALRGLARAEGRAGFRPPASASERAAVARALARLRPLRSLLREVPSVAAYHALVAVLACSLDEADRALAQIEAQDESRETLFAVRELQLQRGQRDQVAEFLAGTRALPAARNDPWLAALAHDLTNPPHCR